MSLSQKSGQRAQMSEEIVLEIRNVVRDEFAAFLDELAARLATQKGQSETLNHDEVCELLNISRTTFYRWRKEGSFPNPVTTGRKRLWLRSQVVEYLNQNKAA